MRKVKLKVVAEATARTRAVIDRRSTDTILFKGSDSDITYTCGSCFSVMIVGLDVKNFHDVVLKCNHCKAFNAVG
jgi:hypothetical protein